MLESGATTSNSSTRFKFSSTFLFFKQDFMEILRSVPEGIYVCFCTKHQWDR